MKTRLCKWTGKPLPENLYNDPRREGIYRYRKGDGQFNYFKADYSEAVRLAEEANAYRRVHLPPALPTLVDRFLETMAEKEPAKTQRRAWKDSSKQLKRWADEHKQLSPKAITTASLLPWWDRLTYDQQHSRMAFFRRFFTWAVTRDECNCNPFNTHADAHLQIREKPAKARSALSLEDFWRVYEQAEDHIRVAMMISLTTTMRRGDIVQLKFSDIVDGHLRRTIAKSLHQRGTAGASHLSWDLFEHKELAKAISDAEKSAQENSSCPYIINLKRKRVSKALKAKGDVSRCTEEMISRGFKTARDKAGVTGQGDKPPTFHEIRGLAITLMVEAYGLERARDLAAHTDGSVTMAYTAGQEPEFVSQSGMVARVR